MRVFVVTAIGALLVLESALRLLGSPPVEGVSDLPLALTRCDPVRGYALRPSATIDYGGIRTTLNALGLRGPLPEGAGRMAVLALGDELTFGWGVSDDQTYPAVLARTLGERCATCGRVVNGGVPGYTTYQGLMLLRELGTRLRPRVVVIAFHLSDALVDARWKRTDETARGCRAGMLAGWLRRWSATYGWLGWYLDAPPHEWWRCEARTPLPRYRRNLLALASEVRRVGGTPVLLDLGFASESAGRAGREREPLFRRGRFEGDYQVALREAARSDGTALVEFIGPELGRETMLDDVRPSAEGYRRIADRLAPPIIDMIAPQ